MSRTIKYHELCHPFREGIKKERKALTKRFRVKEKQFFQKFCETLIKPRDIWDDYCGNPNPETVKNRTSSNFQED